MFEKISSYFGVYSLISTIKMVSDFNYKPFPTSNLVKELFDDNDITNIPFSLRNTIESLKLYTDPNEYQNLISYLTKGLIRNSKRITCAPTGSLSLLLDTSSGIEPVFSYVYSRRISDGVDESGKTKWKILNMYHQYMTDEDIEIFNKTNIKEINENGIESVITPGKLPNENWVNIFDIPLNDHLKPVETFMKYCCMSISKTFNFDNDASIEDIENLYIEAYNKKLKGITVFRNGSRSDAPLIIPTKSNDNVSPFELPTSVKVRKRPEICLSINRKEITPYGSIYLNLAFDPENLKPFELFLNIGKGNFASSLLTALGRVISIAIRSNTDIHDIINTLKYINESDIWSRETIKNNNEGGEVQKICSVPDHIAHILEDILKNSDNFFRKINNITINNKIEEQKILYENKDILEENSNSDTLKCPQCSSQMIAIDGCPRCPNCNYSRCS
jgi:ribonucleoside-diphosphate reductase alpha chain